MTVALILITFVQLGLIVFLNEKINFEVKNLGDRIHPPAIEPVAAQVASNESTDSKGHKHYYIDSMKKS